MESEDTSNKLDLGQGPSDKGYYVTTDVVEADVRPEMGVHGIKETRRELRPRHIQMIAISGAIGTGLFVGSGSSLARAGPLGVLLGYVCFGAITWMCFNSMGEMVCYLPVDGTFIHFAERYVDPSFAFAMAIIYIWNTACVVAAEISAVAGMFNFWNTSINNALWCAIALVVIVALNLLGARYFGEGEFYLSIFKVLLITGLLLFTFITMLGGNPAHDRFGFRYWKNPGVFNEYIATGNTGRFAAFWSTLVQAAFAYGGPDYMSNASAEAQSPRRVMPRVFSLVIYRLLMFYVGGILAVGILVPYNDADLGKSLAGAGSSPFVLASVRLGISGLPHIINAVLLTSALSCGVANCFSASRSLYGFALAGRTPAIFKRTARGVPWVCVLAVTVVASLSFLTAGNSSSTVFTWITNLVGSGNLLVFALFNVTYIRWHNAMRSQNKGRESLPFKVRGQLYFAWIACIGYSVILLTNGFAVFAPGRWSISDFLFAYLTIPIFLVPFIAHKVYSGQFWATPVKRIDLDTGLDAILALDATEPPPPTTAYGKFQRWLWG